MQPRHVKDSAISDQTAVVYPNDLNANGTLFGGRVLELADRLAGIVAKRHTGRVCVTLGIDSVRFLAPARMGAVLVFQASVNQAWCTSLEIGVKVWSEDFRTRERTHIVSAYFTFVALDDAGKPTAIPALESINDEERRRAQDADRRRQHRLQSHS